MPQMPIQDNLVINHKNEESEYNTEQVNKEATQVENLL